MTRPTNEANAFHSLAMSAPQAAEVRGCFIARRLLEDEVFGGAWHLFTNAALFPLFTAGYFYKLKNIACDCQSVLKRRRPSASL